MLRVTVRINERVIFDTHCVRLSPRNPVEGTMCTYRLPNGDLIKQRYRLGTGAIDLAMKLLRRERDWIRGHQ